MRRALVCTLLVALYAQAVDPLAEEMLTAHNAYRERLGLEKLVWSGKLAKAAQAWADSLIKRGTLEHQQSLSTGENLFEVQGASATPDDVVHDWASESLDYDYRKNRCHSKCGHYMQVVWRKTREVGCAVARGGRREVWVCEYKPAGNIEGQRPY